jgi:hypothetical protein
MNKNTSDANHRIITFMANTIIVIMVNAMQQRSMDLHTENRLLRTSSGVVFELQTCGSVEKVLQPPYPRTRYTSPFSANGGELTTIYSSISQSQSSSFRMQEVCNCALRRIDVVYQGQPPTIRNVELQAAICLASSRRPPRI